MGWDIKTLGDICDFSRGLTYKKSDEVSFSNNGVLRANNISLESGTLILDEIKYISEDIEIPETKKVRKGSILICTASGSKKHLGKAALIDKPIDLAFGGFMGMLTPKENVFPKYLYWITQSHMYSEFILNLTDGANINNLKFSQLSDFRVSLPPLEEQKKIVAILDQAFAEIDKARANAEQNLNNARELFDSYLNQVFSQRGDGWEEKKLGEVVIVERGSSPRPIKQYLTTHDDGVNWIKIGDVKEGQKYITSTNQKITKCGAKKSRYVKKGDFILSNSMSFGRPYILQIDGYIHDGWFVLRLPEYIHSDYFYYLLSSSFVSDQFKSLAAGAIVKNISSDLVKKAVLPIPSLTLQKEISLNIERLYKQVESLELIFDKKLRKLAELKKSILQKAFSGELT